MNDTFKREKLARHYKYLIDQGLTDLASGNISSRTDNGMLISPTGASAQSISPESFVEMTLEGEVRGDGMPSSEWQMHAAIYSANEKAGAVVHTHSDHCVALACNNEGLPGFHYLVGLFGGTDVPCVPYATFGTGRLAQHAVAALADRKACLLGNHGMICRGETLEAATKLAHQLEVLCRQYLLARQIGEPDLLTETDWQEFRQKIAEYSTWE